MLRLTMFTPAIRPGFLVAMTLAWIESSGTGLALQAGPCLLPGNTDDTSTPERPRPHPERLCLAGDHGAHIDCPDGPGGAVPDLNSAAPGRRFGSSRSGPGPCTDGRQTLKALIGAQQHPGGMRPITGRGPAPQSEKQTTIGSSTPAA